MANHANVPDHCRNAGRCVLTERFVDRGFGFEKKAMISSGDFLAKMVACSSRILRKKSTV
ncbi:MAG TPA: hypothetical protein P5326_02265 [Candidatus Contendobacter sp.]|nr:hypothetical protein [Candidatus Contendobacter sp.]HRZ22846.1 hypothetical protein [Candidatus Contendobacter sp.]